MSRVREELLAWCATGRVASGRELAALRTAAVVPTPAQWRALLGRLCLWLGTIALAVAVIFFFAGNWDDLDRLAKIGMADAAIVAALLVCWRLDLDGVAGKAVLTALVLLVGALLALAGQIYQTGADSFELFAWWAVLVLPWVVIGRFAPLWLIWLGLLDLAVYCYFSLDRYGETLLWALFALNTLALIVWEAAHRAGLSWLRESWPPRLIAIGSTATATALIVWAILDDRDRAALPAMLAYLVWLTALGVWYRRVRPDAFMLAAGVLSLIVAVATLLSRHLLDAGGGALLFIGVVVIAMSAVGAIWLKSVVRERTA